MGLNIYTRDGQLKRSEPVFTPQAVVMSASLTGSTSIANNAAVTWQRKDIDPYGWYDTSTGRFTPKIAGYYEIEFLLRDSSPPAGGWTSPQIFKNSTPVKDGTFQIPQTQPGSSTGEALVYLNGTTDFVYISARRNDGSTGTYIGSSTTIEHSQFKATLVGSSVGIMPEPWIPLPAGSWTERTDIDYADPGYRKLPSGEVVLRGYISTSAADFTTLPVGYRPAKTYEFYAASWQSSAYLNVPVQVFPTGVIRGHNTSGAGSSLSYLSLNHIRFFTD